MHDGNLRRTMLHGSLHVPSAERREPFQECRIRFRRELLGPPQVVYGPDDRHSMEQPGCRWVSVLRLGSRNNVGAWQSVAMRGRHRGGDIHVRRLVPKSRRQLLHVRDAVLVGRQLYRRLDLWPGSERRRNCMDVSCHGIHGASGQRELQPCLRIQHQ